MKQLIFVGVAAVGLVGCGPTGPSAPAHPTTPTERKNEPDRDRVGTALDKHNPGAKKENSSSALGQAATMTASENETKALSAPARVIVTGKPTMFVEMSGLEVVIQPGLAKRNTREVRAAAFKLDEGSKLVVAFPTDAAPLDEAFKLSAQPAAVEGTLSSTTDPLLVLVSGDKRSKRAPLLIATKVTLIDERNKADFPAENQAWVEGLVEKDETKAGPKGAEWSIRNAGGGLPFLVPKGAELRDGSRVRVGGGIRVVDGQWLLKATKIEPVAK